MTAILTEYERLRLMVSAEADRLEPEYAQQIIHTVCREGGYDHALAIKTYVRDGEPWYVTRDKARQLEKSIEEQLAGVA